MIARSLVAFVLAVLAAEPARAELVYFSTGRTLSVKAHRLEGTTLVLTLRGGGEMTCDVSIVARIEPDEVPYPEEAESNPGSNPYPEDVAEIRLKPDPTNVDAVEGPLVFEPAAQLVADSRYDPIIERVSARHGVDATLVRAVIQVESNYQYRARSASGAKGLMQLMPATARQYGLSNPYDPAANIEAGIRHLKSLLERFPLSLALAAYNAGEAAVHRYNGVPPYAETRIYVARILRLVGRAV